MATSKKKRGGKKPKKADSIAATEDDVASRLLDPPPRVEDVPVSAPPQAIPVESVSAKPMISRKVVVRNIPDPSAKIVVLGRKSLNFRYGPHNVSIIKGQRGKIPAGARAHCKKLGLI